MRYQLTPPPLRSELACATTMLVAAVLFCCVAPALLLLPVARWVRKQASITARELWSDKWELAAYLFALAVLAFLVFLFPY